MRSSFAWSCVLSGAVALLVGCASRSGGQRETIAQTPVIAGVDGHPIVSMPIIIDGWSTVLVPLAMTSSKGLFEKDDPFAKGGLASYAGNSMGKYPSADLARTEYSYRSADLEPRPTSWNTSSDVRWHNIMARDSSNKEWLLLDRRGVIGTWNQFGVAIRRENVVTIECFGALVIAVVDDSNHDGNLNDLDARVAIVTDKHGLNPRQISPADAQVWEAIYDLQTNAIYLEVVKDTTKDGYFGHDDDSMIYVWTRGSTEPAKPIVSDDTLKRALDLLK